MKREKSKDKQKSEKKEKRKEMEKKKKKKKIKKKNKIKMIGYGLSQSSQTPATLATVPCVRYEWSAEPHEPS
jgi:hypothetical protein